jgi:hypothetical protein
MLTPSQTNNLVVEGFINVKGYTTITLRRTVPLKDTARLKAEIAAEVTIVGEDNSTYLVKEKGSGMYISDSLNLRVNQKYRVHIKTRSGGDYLSENVEVMQTPSIDSVNWKVENDGVRFYVNTHGDQNNSRYYKWDYEETWEIHSSYENYFEYKKPVVIPRKQEEVSKLFYCWAFQNSSSILIGSTAQLTNNVISLAPVNFISLKSEKFSVRYSILIKQYSLDRKGYDFFQAIKSNTESLGSIFDAQPSEITGNISCVSNPAEKVIGYIAASTVDQKRIFILSSDVPGKYATDCPTVEVPLDSLAYYFEIGGLRPYNSISMGGPITGYYSSYPSCIDCTLRGTNVKPSFW